MLPNTMSADIPIIHHHIPLVVIPTSVQLVIRIIATHELNTMSAGVSIIHHHIPLVVIPMGA